MDGTASKAEAIRPVLLKAGIPLAISVAGFICAKMMARRDIKPDDSALENKVSSLETDSCKEFREEQKQSYHSPNSTTTSTFKDGVCEVEEIITSTHFANSMGISKYEDEIDYEQEILRLQNQVEELQKRDWEIKMQFARYHELKEQESVLTELKNMLLLEKANVEFLVREISSIEAENKRLDNLVAEYLKVLRQLDHWRSQSRLLQGKVKNFLRKTKEKSRVIRAKNSKTEALEAELSRKCDELEERSAAIKKLENQVEELQSVIDQSLAQNNELESKLKLADQSAPSISKIEDQGTTMQDYKQLVNEYEQLQKERAAEVKELIYLRWTNACLRHELTRNHAPQEQNKDKNIVEFEGSGDFEVEHHLNDLDFEHADAVAEPCFNVANGGSSKRQKLLQKLKRWVDGGEKMRSKQEIKCLGRHSVSYEAEEEHTILARKSCSSA